MPGQVITEGSGGSSGLLDTSGVLWSGRAKDLVGFYCEERAIPKVSPGGILQGSSVENPPEEAP